MAHKKQMWRTLIAAQASKGITRFFYRFLRQNQKSKKNGAVQPVGHSTRKISYLISKISIRSVPRPSGPNQG